MRPQATKGCFDVIKNAMVGVIARKSGPF